MDLVIGSIFAVMFILGIFYLDMKMKNREFIEFLLVFVLEVIMLVAAISLLVPAIVTLAASAK